MSLCTYIVKIVVIKDIKNTFNLTHQSTINSLGLFLTNCNVQLTFKWLSLNMEKKVKTIVVY